MPGPLTGIGTTRREARPLLALDKIIPGASVAQASFFSFPQPTGALRSTTIYNREGKNLIMCGRSKVGDGNVCGK